MLVKGKQMRIRGIFKITRAEKEKREREAVKKKIERIELKGKLLNKRLQLAWHKANF